MIKFLFGIKKSALNVPLRMPLFVPVRDISSNILSYGKQLSSSFFAFLCKFDFLELDDDLLDGFHLCSFPSNPITFMF